MMFGRWGLGRLKQTDKGNFERFLSNAEREQSIFREVGLAPPFVEGLRDESVARGVRGMCKHAPTLPFSRNLMQSSSLSTLILLH